MVLQINEIENDVVDPTPVLKTTTDSRLTCTVCFKSVTLATHKRKKLPNNLQQITDIEKFKTRAIQWTNYEHEYTQFLREIIGVSRKFMSIRIADHHFLRILLWKTRMLKFCHLIIRTLTQQYSMNQHHHHHQFAQQCLGEARGLL